VRPLTKGQHRSDERFGWESKSLPPQQRGLKRTHAVLAAAALAKTQPKAKAKAKAKAKTRSWQHH
jgi:hypothetical protein